MVIGIDIGGTSVKIGLVSQDGKVKYRTLFRFKNKKNQDTMINELADYINNWIKENNIKAEAIGIGCPGVINSDLGECCYSGNLKWDNLKVCDCLTKKTGLKSKITNDANAATLAEWHYGQGKGFDNVIMLTLGTGVGGGLILNNQLFEGNYGMGSEIGHMTLKINGDKCSCGRKGCFEAYASATAIIKLAKKEMQKNRETKLWEACMNDIKNLDGQIIFTTAHNGDAIANKVVDKYIYYLGEGMLSLANIFRPDIIILGGGIALQGEFLVNKLKEYFRKHNFGFPHTPEVDIKTSILDNNSGIIGAACLWFNN